MCAVKYRRSKRRKINAFSVVPGERYDSVTLAPDQRERNFAAHDFNTVAADAHVNYSAIAARKANKNS
jgi:hypothetical protein